MTIGVSIGDKRCCRHDDNSDIVKGLRVILRVSKDRYEESPDVIERAVRGSGSEK